MPVEHDSGNRRKTFHIWNLASLQNMTQFLSLVSNGWQLMSLLVSMSHIHLCSAQVGIWIKNILSSPIILNGREIDEWILAKSIYFTLLNVVAVSEIGRPLQCGCPGEDRSYYRLRSASGWKAIPSGRMSYHYIMIEGYLVYKKNHTVHVK